MNQESISYNKDGSSCAEQGKNKNSWPTDRSVRQEIIERINSRETDFHRQVSAPAEKEKHKIYNIVFELKYQSQNQAWTRSTLFIEQTSRVIYASIGRENGTNSEINVGSPYK